MPPPLCTAGAVDKSFEFCIPRQRGSYNRVSKVRVKLKTHLGHFLQFDRSSFKFFLMGTYPLKID